MRKVTNVLKIFIRKHEGKRPVMRPRHISEDNIETDLKNV
jgi:hypothetical protein